MNLKLYVAVFLLIILVFVSGCTGSSRDEEGTVDYRTGTRGLEMRFVEGTPPKEVYEGDYLPITIEFFNKGVYPIFNGELYLAGYDHFIINNMIGGSIPGNLPTYGTPFFFTIDDAKSQFNDEGGYKVEEFNSGIIELPDGTTIYDVPLIAYACYNYQTKGSADVCIDPQPHRTNIDKPCITTDVSMGAGQGAPVSVSHVDVTNMRDKVRLTFTIRNSGEGTVVDSMALNRGACPTGFGPADIDVVYLEKVRMGFTLLTDCQPSGKIKMTNGMGKVTCTAGIGGTTAFTTPVEVTLNYGYKTFIKKNIQIKGYD